MIILVTPFQCHASISTTNPKFKKGKWGQDSGNPTVTKPVYPYVQHLPLQV